MLIGARRLSLALFFVLQTSALHLEAHAQSLNQLVKEEGAKVASAFGVETAINVKSGGGYISQKDSGVIIDLDRLNLDLAKTNETLKTYRLRWILGHEIWHQVQFKQYGAFSSNDPPSKSNFPSADPLYSRLFECQADMLGAHYTGQTLALAGTHEDNWQSFSEAARTIAQLADDLSDQNEAPGGHPDPDQRETAIVYGMIRAFADQLGKDTSGTDANLLLTLKGSVEVISDETTQSWSYRLCEKIVHVDGAAVSALALKDESPPWPKDSFAGSFQLRYTNTADRSIRARLSVIFAVVNVGGVDIPPMPLQSREFEFELRPGATQTLSGVLGSGTPIPNAQVALIYPRRRYAHYTLFSAEFLDDEPTRTLEKKIVPTTDDRNLRPSAKLLFSLLPDLAFESEEKFLHRVSGICDNSFSDEKRCPVNFVFPGSTRSTLVLEKSGAAYISSDLYDGDSRAEAVKVFQSLVDDVRAIYPTIRAPYPDINKKNPRFEVDLSNHAALEAYVLEPRRSGDTYTTSVDVKSTW